jgi:hypothetical protein
MYLLGSYDRNDIFQPSWRETNKTTPKLLALSPRPGPLRRRPAKSFGVVLFFSFNRRRLSTSTRENHCVHFASFV